MDEQMVGVLPEDEQAPPEEPGPGWGWRDVLATIVLTVVASVALLLGGRFIIQALALSTEGGLLSPALYIVGAGVYLAVLLGVYLFAARRAGWAALGLRRPPLVEFLIVPPLFVAGTFALLIVNGAIAVALGSFDNPQTDSLTGGQALGPVQLIAGLVLVAGLVPFAEELLFRGMIYPLLRARLGMAGALASNALLFALVHFIPLLVPGLFIVGLLLAYLRERSGSIWPSVLYHAMQNGLALLLINLALQIGA